VDVYSLDAMAKLAEEDFRNRVLTPLLKKLGYFQIKDWHGGSAEQGKDIICWKANDLGHRRNLAIVAKAVNFGKNASKQDVRAQVEQSLNLTFFDKETGEEQIVHDCWVVTNKNIAVGSNNLLWGTLGPSLKPRVTILDGRDIWNLVVQHFPVELSQAIQEVSERISSGEFATQLILGEVERPIARFTVGNRTVVIGEKQPGQLDAKPFEFPIAFDFSVDEAGRSKAEELRRAIEGRGAASIPEQYIKRFDIPEHVIEQVASMLGAVPEQFTEVEITPIEARHRILVALELFPDGEDPSGLPYLDMVEQSRTEEVTIYTNDHQPIPILATLKLVPDSRQLNWSVSQRPGPMAVPWYLNYLRLNASLDHPGEASLTILDPGIPWGRSRYPGRTTPEVTSEMIDWVADLAMVQTRTGVPIYIPNRELSDDEIETIRLLRNILKNPVVSQTWTGAKLDFEWNVEQARAMFEVLTSSEELRFRAVESRVVEIFGTQIPMGRVEQVFSHARLADADDLRRSVESLTEGVGEFAVSIVPGSSNKAEARYLDWGALTKEDEDAVDVMQAEDLTSDSDDIDSQEAV
jgi:hypothetical protein